MCYYISNNLTKKEIKDSFGVEYNALDFKGSGFLNGFSHPKTPIIMDENPDEAILGDWGLIPLWAKNRDVQKMTLNARIETWSMVFMNGSGWILKEKIRRSILYS